MGRTQDPATFAVERRSIDFIPDAERHGRAWHLFTVWFGANMQVTTVATGALAVVLGLSLPWAIVAVAVGNVYYLLHRSVARAVGGRGEAGVAAAGSAPAGRAQQEVSG